MESEDVFAVEWGALTGEERDAVMALVGQQTAHGIEVLEALDENVAALAALLDLIESSGAPSGTTLGEALVAGYFSVAEVVERVRGVVADPLVGQGPE